jgi:hypothetical protein
MSTKDHEDEVCRMQAELLPQSHHNRSLLERLRIDCPRSGDVHTGAECARCERFVAWALPDANTGAEVICRLPCPACGDPAAARELVTPMLCDDCRESARSADCDDELGVGD